MRLTRTSGKPHLQLLITPLPSSLSAHEEGRAHRLVLILIAEAGSTAHISGRLLVELYGLTATEAQLALAISEGKRPADIARDKGVRISTVRSQISSVFAKLRVERQSDLVRVLASIPALHP